MVDLADPADPADPEGLEGLEGLKDLVTLVIQKIPDCCPSLSAATALALAGDVTAA